MFTTSLKSSPAARKRASADKFADGIAKKLGADKAFARRVEEVEICGSVDNRLALARECMQRGLYEDAARLYRHCMEGLYADDPNLLLGLSEALVEKQDYAGARATLEKLTARDAAFKPNDVSLLRDRAQEGLGDNDAALREYATLLPVYVGLEARYRHGLLLKKLGRADEANNAFCALRDHARKHNVSHDDERAWLNLAMKELKG